MALCIAHQIYTQSDRLICMHTYVYIDSLYSGYAAASSNWRGLTSGLPYVLQRASVAHFMYSSAGISADFDTDYDIQRQNRRFLRRKSVEFSRKHQAAAGHDAGHRTHTEGAVRNIRHLSSTNGTKAQSKAPSPSPTVAAGMTWEWLPGKAVRVKYCNSDTF